MITAPIPPDEAERLADLRALELLDTPPEERFDRLVRLAAEVFDVPMAYIALVDSERQWFKAKCGLTVDQTGREISFCGHAILGDGPMVVPDATQDQRFHDNPLVVDEPYVRFYAGHPLAGPCGRKVGTFCIVDRRSRALDDAELERFRRFAMVAEHELQMVDLIKVQRELLQTKNTLMETQKRLADELAEAARYVESLLPPKLDGPVRTDWRFISSSQLGGDSFGYHWLDDRQLAVYLLDVCGHGVGASLLSVSIHTALRRRTLPDTSFQDPGDVLTALNRAFPMSEHQDKFFTAWYGVYDTTSRTLRYASGGHPPGMVVDASGAVSARLGEPTFMLGLFPDAAYQTRTHLVSPGSRAYVYSDGVYEVHKSDGRLLGLDGLAEMLSQVAGASGSRVDALVERIRALQGSFEFVDDFSLLEMEFE